MSSTWKLLVALAVALVAMLAFRALVFTIYYVDSSSLEPHFVKGDHVMVNRWSYGLRTGDGRLFDYGRLCRQDVGRGDLIAFDDSLGRVFISRCTALPGDTVRLTPSTTVAVPSTRDCAEANFYLTESYGFVSEQQIIGRAVMVVYSHDPDYPFWHGYIASRFMLLK